MLKQLCILFFLVVSFSTTYSQRYWVSGTTANWSGDNWSSTSGGAPDGGGPPTGVQTANFDGNGLGKCVVDIAANFGGITINATFNDTIDINGNTFNITGNASNTVAGGVIDDTPGSSTFFVNSTGVATFSGTTFLSEVDVSSNSIQLNGSIFNDSTTVTKTSGGTSGCNGGNVFNGITSVTNTSNGIFQLASISADTFNNDVTFSTTGTSFTRVAYIGNSTFNGNIVINNASGGGVYFGQGGGISTLAAGKTISIGPSGFGAGVLYLGNFTQLGNTPQTLNLTGASSLQIQNGTTFNGNLTTSHTGTGSTYFYTGSIFNGTINTTSPQIYLSGAIFNDTTQITKTGSGSDGGSGGNTYNGITTITNAGTNYLNLAAGAADTFNTDVTFNITSHYIRAAYLSHTMFNGNIVVNNASGAGIYFGQGGGATLAAGKTITVGPFGFSTGLLSIGNFNQLGNTPQTLTLTGNSSLQIQSGTTFNGNLTTSQTGTGSTYFYANTVFNGTVNTVSSQVYLSGAEFNDTTSITKTGSASDGGSGGNVYNGITTLTNAGTNYFVLGGGSVDTFNTDVTFNITGTHFIRVAYLSNTVFNGNIEISNVAGGGIYFGQAGGVSTLANGKTISVGASGFNAGLVHFRNFVQVGNTAQTINFTGSSSLQFENNTTFNGNLVANQTGTGSIYFYAGSTFNGTVNATSPNIYPNGTTFNDTTTLTKTGSASPNIWASGNNFNGITTINNNSNNYIRMGSSGLGDTFAQDVAFNNNGTTSGGYIEVGYGGSTANSFLGNITVSNPNGGFIRFGVAGGTSSLASGKTISAGAGGFKKGSLQLYNFTQLGNTPQDLSLSNTASILFQSSNTFNGNLIAVMDSGSVTFGPSNTFNGTLTATGDNVTFSGASAFNDTTTLTKDGSASPNQWASGNNFNGITTINNNSNNYIRMAGSGTGDTFNQNVTFNNNGTTSGGYIEVGYGGSSTNTFSGNIVVTNPAGGFIRFGVAGGTSSLASGKTISIGPTGFKTGGLHLYNFTQLGNTPQDLSLTNTASLLFLSSNTFNGNLVAVMDSGSVTFGPSNTFNGTLTTTGDNITFSGASTFNDTTTLTKDGSASPNQWDSGNNFNGITTINNNSNNYIRMAGSGTGDTFNQNVTFNNNGTTSGGYIEVGYGGSSTNTFSGNIVVTNPAGGFIRFGVAGGTSSLANGKTISIGPTGFKTGGLHLYNFTQLGNTQQDLSLTNTASLNFASSNTFNGNVIAIMDSGSVSFGPSNTFNGTLLATGDNINFSGASTFNDTTTLTKDNSASPNGWASGNNFNGITTINNNSNNYIRIASSGAGDTFNQDVTFNNNGTTSGGYIEVGYGGGSTNTFSGNIVLTNPNGGFIRFGVAGGTSSLANGKTISIGPTGFKTGGLHLYNFTQLGNTPQNLSLSNTASLNFASSNTFNGNLTTFVDTGTTTFSSSNTFNGNVTTSSGEIYLQGAIFNDTTSFTKTGTGTNYSNGGNAFNGVTSFTNSGTGEFRLANSTVDTYASHVNFIKTSSGLLRPAYNGTTDFVGDLGFDINTPITLGEGNGIIRLVGTADQNITELAAATAEPIFERLVVDNANDEIHVTTPIAASVSITFTNGNFVTADTATLSLFDNISMSGVSDNSFVDGPVKKVGNDAFIFPTGDSGLYRPISISAPSNTTDAFTAEYLKQNPGPTYDRSLTDTLMAVSACEYWNLNQTAGSSSITVTPSWRDYAPAQPCSGVADLPGLRVARWDGAQWVNEKNLGTTGNTSAGTIDSRIVNAFGPFTLASQPGLNPLPVEITQFDAEEMDNVSVLVSWTTEVEISNHYFLVQRSTDLVNWEDVSTVLSQAYFNSGNSSSPLHYETYDFAPHFGTSYYRLKQFDLNGDMDIPTSPESVYFQGLEIVNVYPNPAENQMNYIVNVHTEGDLDVFVYDSKGRVVSKETYNIGWGINRFTLDVSPFADGVYLLKVATPDHKHYDFKQFITNRP